MARFFYMRQTGNEKSGKNRAPRPGKPMRSQPKKRLSPGQLDKIAHDVEKSASSLCAGEGLELVHVEFVSESNHYFLRVYIDKPGGVTMDDLSAISRQLGDILDARHRIDPEYRLEVSSPGIFRPLFKKSDYTKFAGRNVMITVGTAIEGKKKFTGILNGISDNDNVTLSVEGRTMEIQFSAIKKARLAEDNGDDRC